MSFIVCGIYDLFIYWVPACVSLNVEFVSYLHMEFVCVIIGALVTDSYMGVVCFFRQMMSS